MDVSYGVWAITLTALIAVLIIDLALVVRRPHEPSLRESASWAIFYIALAGVFGLWVWAGYGATPAAEFYTGFVIEKSLSVDNLFIFMLIMSRFAVPRQYQQKVLMVGIILALLMRGVFIAAGAVLVSNFMWVFYLFGLFLIYTGVKLARSHNDDPANFKENALVRFSRRVLPMSSGYAEGRLTTMQAGRRLVTPMLIVMIAIGTTDLIFAVDSIPAIFGVTREPYLVFTANVFALMGLRQLYFLIGGLVSRLVYLSTGLAVVLVFIGVKMVFEALAENTLPFINNGEHVSWAPHLPIWLSLLVIIGILGVTAGASLVKSARDRRRALTPQG
ncbi:TerC family protein [Natronosporangium hydrolyticum]|uniref:TerC family protein n=1 Tax=Natronosporangium hydrolyticum TaxID=2811111 RepID=A0A895YGY1_9ACTN|nr:TerC family protein [Natronosporangium hydrolyticum]QSB12948.1 TerC family protein [Natronosporangium hydrolyticum]